MHFLANAGAMLAGRQCLTCDCDIKAHHSVYLDIDGDGDSERVTINHAWCFSALEEAANRRELETWREAAKIAAHNTAADTVTACQSRANQIKHRLEGHSGADIPRALGLVS